MPLAVTHMLIPMIIVGMIRDHIFKKKKRFLPNKYVLLAGLFGLFPDLDVPLSYLTLGNLGFHRLITHSIWFPLAFFLGFLISYFYIKKRVYYKIFLMLFVGFSTHIILDYSLLGYVCLFCPFNSIVYGLNALPIPKELPLYASIDAILLFFWLIHEELEHKISDFF